MGKKYKGIRFTFKYFGGPMDGQMAELESRGLEKNPDKTQGFYQVDSARSTGQYIAAVWQPGRPA